MNCKRKKKRLEPKSDFYESLFYGCVWHKTKMERTINFKFKIATIMESLKISVCALSEESATEKLQPVFFDLQLDMME